MEILFLSGVLFLSAGHPLQMERVKSDVWVADSKVIKLQISGSKLWIKALKEEGSTHLSGLPAPYPALTKLQILSDADYQALQKCSGSYLDLQKHPLHIQNRDWILKAASCGFENLSVAPSIQKQSESVFLENEKKLLKNGLRIEKVDWLSNGKRRLILAQNEEVKSHLKKELQELAPFYDIQFQDLPRPGRTLVFLLTIFEFSRNKAQNLGVTWPQSFFFNPLEGRGLRTQEGKGLELGLDFGESLGLGKILAQPQVRTRPGEKASFQSGGEIPIKVKTASGYHISWKPYGLILSLTPHAQVKTGAQEISVDFNLEVSQPDLSQAIDGIPGVSMRKLESKFDLRTQETTVLTTMIRTQQGVSRGGLPTLSEVPFFQRLFSKRADSEHEMELWFALKPTWEEIPSLAPSDRKEAFRDL